MTKLVTVGIIDLVGAISREEELVLELWFVPSQWRSWYHSLVVMCGCAWRKQWRALMWRMLLSKTKVGTLVLLHQVGMTSLVMPFLALRDKLPC